MGHLHEQLLAVLGVTSGQTARQLEATLEVGRSIINSELYRRTDTFVHDGAQPPRWSLRTAADASSSTHSRAARNRSASPTRRHHAELHGSLYPWQRRALDHWTQADHRGVIEAVTGAGKTRVGLAAIADALDSSMRVLVVVPTTVLLDQWRQQIHEHLGLQAGALGGGHKARLADHQVVVAMVHSASRIERLLPVSAGGLIVCDEVHRYGATTFARVLQEPFVRRLGLTATFERNDDGLDDHLLPYFGDVAYSLSYREALAEQVIAPFRVAIVRVDLDAEEQDHYEDAHREAQAARTTLIRRYHLPQEPFGEFMAEVALLAGGPRKDPATRLARRFLSSFTETRRILGETPRKLDVLSYLDPAIVASHGTLIFASTVNGALRAAHTVANNGIRADALHSDMKLAERRAVLNRFEQRELQVVAAPLVLDEGVDVPDANLAIILAASKTRRQMIQRLGRVVRVKADGGCAHLALVVARNTSEDPASGTHLDFITEMLDVADELRVFDPPQHGELARFLTGGTGGTHAEFTGHSAVPPSDALDPHAPTTRSTSTRAQATRSPDPPDDRDALTRSLAPLLAAAAAASPTRTSTEPSTPSSAPRTTRAKAAPESDPLGLHIRILLALAKRPRTCAGLATELGVAPHQLLAVLESSSQFHCRARVWRLTSQKPAPQPPNGPADLPTEATTPPPDPDASHPLVIAWEALEGPMNDVQRAHFKRAMQFVWAGLNDRDEARRFVHLNRSGIRAKLRQ